MPTSVAIVEDNADIADELEKLLSEEPSFTCLGVCRNLQTALRKIPALAPDVVIMDIQLPDGSGIQAITRLKPILPRTQFIVFTIFNDQDQIFKALEAGANGYLLKCTSSEEMLRAIREVNAGGAPMTPEIARKVIQSFRRTPATAEQLTPREEQILQLLAKGQVPKEVSQTLAISIDTVNSHLKHIYDKLQVRTRTEAVIKYLK